MTSKKNENNRKNISIYYTSSTTLRDSVIQAMDEYFNYLDGESATDIYQMVMVEVESALLSSVLRHVNDNKSKAAEYLGISRGTLLKKLNQYQLHPFSKKVIE